jgi:hypothetical protein
MRQRCDTVDHPGDEDPVTRLGWATICESVIVALGRPPTINGAPLQRDSGDYLWFIRFDLPDPFTL